MDSRPKVTKPAIEQALLVMDAHINALNQRDANAIASTLHFPHHRLSGVQWKTWETAEHYFHDFLERAGTNWHYSTFENIKVVDSSVNKVHLDVEVCGVWATKVRSSFAMQ